MSLRRAGGSDDERRTTCILLSVIACLCAMAVAVSASPASRSSSVSAPRQEGVRGEEGEGAARLPREGGEEGAAGGSRVPAKAKAQFDGGATAGKGCFASSRRSRTWRNRDALPSVGDTAAIEAEVDAFVNALVCPLGGDVCSAVTPTPTPAGGGTATPTPSPSPTTLPPVCSGSLRQRRGLWSRVRTLRFSELFGVRPVRR